VHNLGEKAMIAQEQAETFALQAFIWVIGGELADAFINATGASQDQLTKLAQQPVFLGAVLDFLMEDDARVIGFCDSVQRPYLSVMEARAALPGGQLPHWT